MSLPGRVYAAWSKHENLVESGHLLWIDDHADGMMSPCFEYGMMVVEQQLIWKHHP